MPYFILGFAVFLALVIVRFAMGKNLRPSAYELGVATTSGDREINADETDWSYYQDELLIALASGIGREHKARTAARAAVHAATRMFDIRGAGDQPVYFFRNAFNGANSSVLRYIPDGSAGASLLVAALRDGKLYYALAGNCRIAVFRGGSMVQVSEGHTFNMLARNAYERQEIGRVDALQAVQNHRTYNFVGKYGFQELELFDLPVMLKRRDIVVLMTDSVAEAVPDGQMDSLLGARKSCDEIARSIISSLKDREKTDQGNATVLLVRVKKV